MLRNSRHPALYVTVHISNVRDVRGLVYDGRVVDVRDRCVIDRRVADVDPLYVRAADLIRRHIHFARAEGEPSDVAAPSATAADEDD